MDLDLLAALYFGLVALGAAALGAYLAGPGRRIKWAGLCFLLPFALLWLVARRARGIDVDGPPPAPRPAPEPVPVAPPEAVQSLRTPVTACPDCGFLGVRPPSLGDGVFAGGGELIGVVCPRCHYRGIPVEFARGEDYLDYVRKLGGRAAP